MFSGNGDSGDTVATISATRIFVTQLCTGMKKAHDVIRVMSLFICNYSEPPLEQHEGGAYSAG